MIIFLKQFGNDIIDVSVKPICKKDWIMKRNGLIVIVFLILLSYFESSGQSTPVNLKCEYLVNPIGIDVANPRLIWHMKTGKQGAFQQAYEFFVGTDSVNVAVGKGNVWDSDQVSSNVMPIIYQGQNLNLLPNISGVSKFLMTRETGHAFHRLPVLKRE